MYRRLQPAAPRAARLYDVSDTPAFGRPCRLKPAVLRSVGRRRRFYRHAMRSRGYLPHIENAGLVQHIIFRVAGSLPPALLDRAFDDDEAQFLAIDAALDEGRGERVLADPVAADIVAAQLARGDGYTLKAWCVMPTHVHVLAHVAGKNNLGRIVRSWKGASARAINLALGREGRIWAREWFDRYMRDDAQFFAAKAYIERNPVVAGLCDAPEAWRWSSAWT